MDKYISQSPIKTPAMTVTVYDANNNVHSTFEAPPGLQLQPYLAELYQQ